MKKFLLILIPLLVIGGGVYWFFAKEKAGNKSRPTGIVQKMKEDQDKSITGSLKDVIGLGSSLKCSWSSGDVSGESWIKGDKVYTKTTTPDAKMNTIFVDDCVWSWNEDEAAGMKICYDLDEEAMKQDADDMEKNLESYAKSLEQQEIVESADDINYKCSKAVISDMKFNPPVNVTFSSLDDLMQGSLEDLEKEVQDMMPENMDY